MEVDAIMARGKDASFYHFKSIELMPDIPHLKVPDYKTLSKEFRKTFADQKSGILRYSENGHPVFGAYLQSNSNEMVTWGILAVGEWLCSNNTDWIAPTYPDFYDKNHGIYLNSPQKTKIEYWYLFYVNTLAGAVLRTLYVKNSQAVLRMGSSADSLFSLAQRIDYNFNDQGYDFKMGKPFTHRDIFRQPDSIAGYAYNMLFAALQAGRSEYLAESKKAIHRYENFSHNPWYEIPNGSAGVLASSWLNAHGFPTDVKKAAGFVFDHEEGPLQIGCWGKEAINGLMMGWRGESRQYALSSAYSMETLMPMQFLLPSVKYCPPLADAVAKYMLNALSSFQLFFAKGTEPLYETKAELNAAIPYEKLEKIRDGHMPAACGDFWGHRSVYGAGYLSWLDALVTETTDSNIYAYDLSITDWLAERVYPVYLLRNPYGKAINVSFFPSDIWENKCPELYKGNHLQDVCLWNMQNKQILSENAEKLSVTLVEGEAVIIALLPKGVKPEKKGKMICAGNVELCAEF